MRVKQGIWLDFVFVWACRVGFESASSSGFWAWCRPNCKSRVACANARAVHSCPWTFFDVCRSPKKLICVCWCSIHSQMWSMWCTKDRHVSLWCYVWQWLASAQPMSTDFSFLQALQNLIFPYISCTFLSSCKYLLSLFNRRLYLSWSLFHVGAGGCPVLVLFSFFSELNSCNLNYSCWCGFKNFRLHFTNFNVS